MPVGADYLLLISSRGSRTGTRTSEIKVRPGETTDVGTLDVSTGKRLAEEQPKAAVRADVPITGRIIDLEGRPVAGVTVKVGSVRLPKADDLGPWLEGVKKGEPPWVATRHIDYDRKSPENAARQVVKTGTDGRFRLDGFGSDRIVTLELSGATIAFTNIETATRKMDPIPAPGFANQFGPGKQTIYGADLTYSAAPSRPIEGHVKDGTTGRPLADVEIRSDSFAGSNYAGIKSLKTTTDKEGRFQLDGMPKGKGNQILVVPSDDQPYFMQEIRVPDPPGAGHVSVELAMERGLWIEGKLTEAGTGTAVAGARLHYFAFLENKFAQAHPAFNENGPAGA